MSPQEAISATLIPTATAGLNAPPEIPPKAYAIAVTVNRLLARMQSFVRWLLFINVVTVTALLKNFYHLCARKKKAIQTYPKELGWLIKWMETPEGFD